MPKYSLSSKEPGLSVQIKRSGPSMKDSKCIDLIVDDYYVVGLTSEGELEFYEGIPKDIGLKVTETGRIKVAKSA